MQLLADVGIAFAYKNWPSSFQTSPREGQPGAMPPGYLSTGGASAPVNRR